MQATRSNTPPLALAALALALALPQAAHAQTTVNYSGLGTFTQNLPLDTGGVTANAGAGTLSIFINVVFGGLVVGGLGVLGSDTLNGEPLIDGTESVLFTFDGGSATAVSYTSTAAETLQNPRTISIQSFGASGTSLGTVQVDPVPAVMGAVSISALFGNVSLSGFRFTGNTGVGMNVQTLIYTPKAAPEPSPAAVFVLAVLGLFGLIQRVRLHKFRRHV